MNPRWIVSVAVLLLLPLGAGVWLLDGFDHLKYQESLDRQQETLNRLISGFARRAGRVGYFQEAVTRIRQSMAWDQDPAPLVAALPPRTARVFLFSSEGKRLLRQGFSQDLVAASERVHRYLAANESDAGGITSPRDRKLVEAFLGAPGAISLMRESPGRLVNLESIGVGRSAAYVPFRSRKGVRGSMIFLVDHEAVSTPGLIRAAERKMRSLAGSGFDFGVSDLQNASTALSRFVANPAAEPSFQSEGRAWATTLHDSRFLLFCNAELPTPLSPFHQRHFDVSLVLLIAGLLGFGVIMALARHGIPLRLLTGFLFTLAGLACILVMLGFGALYLETRRVVAQRQRIDRSFEILLRLDEGFPTFCRSIEQRYRRVLDGLGPLARLGSQLRTGFRTFPGCGRDFSVILFNASGTVAQHLPSPAHSILQGIWGESPLEPMGKIVDFSITMFNALMSTGDNVRNPVFVNASPLIRRGGLEMNRALGTISTIRFGSKALTSYFDYLYAGENRPTGAAWIVLRPLVLEQAYVRGIRTKPWVGDRLFSSRFRIMSAPQAGNIACEKSFRPFLTELFGLRDEIAQTRGPGSRIVAHRSRSYLLSGYPGRQLGGLDLFCLTPLSDIERDGDRLSRLFLGIASLVLLFALALSSVFSRMLLHPMREMGEGLQRLSESDVRKDLQLATGDEFEAIGGGINAIAEEMKELSFAKGIREQLIPGQPLLMPHAGVFGWTHSRSEIGGEVFDFQQLPDGSTLLWIAGRPGHSIGSALLLAMTKMAVRILSDLGITSPRELLLELARQFPDPMAGFTDGEHCFCLLDPVARRLQLACRGNFSVLIARGKTPDIDRAALVDGQAEGDGIRVGDLELAPGDRVYLLSPGLARETGTVEQVTVCAGLPSEEAGPTVVNNLWGNGLTMSDRATVTLLLCEVCKA